MSDKQKEEVEEVEEVESAEETMEPEKVNEEHPEKSRNYTGKIYNPKTDKFKTVVNGKTVKS